MQLGLFAAFVFIVFVSSLPLNSAKTSSSRRSEDLWYLEDSVPWPPMPYAFGYEVRDHQGNEQYRKESSDGRRVTGSYGYWGPDGIYRHVDYVADENGYRANIRTSEPGTANEDPAAVRITAMPTLIPPAYPSSRGPPPPSFDYGTSPPGPPPSQPPYSGPPSSSGNLPPGAVRPGGRRRFFGGRGENPSYSVPGRKTTPQYNVDFKRRSDNPDTMTTATLLPQPPAADPRDAYNPSRKGPAPSQDSDVQLRRSNDADDKSSGRKSQRTPIDGRRSKKGRRPPVKVFITGGPVMTTKSVPETVYQSRDEQQKQELRQEMHSLGNQDALKDAYSKSFAGQRFTTQGTVTYKPGLYEVPAPPADAQPNAETIKESLPPAPPSPLPPVSSGRLLKLPYASHPHHLHSHSYPAQHVSLPYTPQRLGDYPPSSAEPLTTPRSISPPPTTESPPEQHYRSNKRQDLKFDDDIETSRAKHTEFRQNIYYHPLPFSHQHHTIHSENENKAEQSQPAAKSHGYSVLFPKPISYQYSHQIIHLNPRKMPPLPAKLREDERYSEEQQQRQDLSQDSKSESSLETTSAPDDRSYRRVDHSELERETIYKSATNAVTASSLPASESTPSVTSPVPVTMVSETTTMAPLLVSPSASTVPSPSSTENSSTESSGDERSDSAAYSAGGDTPKDKDDQPGSNDWYGMYDNNEAVDGNDESIWK